MVEIITAIGIIIVAVVAAGVTIRIVSKRNRSSTVMKAKDQGINVNGGVKGGLKYRAKD